MKALPEIVLVDDEVRVTQSLEREIRIAFGENTFRVTSINEPRQAEAYILAEQDGIFLVISDLRMPTMTGSELLARVREASPMIQTVLLTAYTDMDNIQKAVSASIQSLMFKPWTRDALSAEIRKAHEEWDLRKQHQLLQRRLETMLLETGDFQTRLFSSSIPYSPSVITEIAFLPHEEYHCGGDFYDIHAPDRSSMLVILGDVSGHGPKSAMVTGILKTTINTILATEPELLSEPDLLMYTLNTQFCRLLENSPEILIGLTALYIDTKNTRLSLSIAGLPGIVLVRGGKPQLLKTQNQMLGIFPESLFSKTEADILPGDSLCLFTDGMIESVPDFFVLSEQAILSEFQTIHPLSAKKTASRFRTKLPEGRFSDDVTCISLQIDSRDSDD
jgi:sigma-B regulation protein RsbU (phosphoserine phosphatase)